MTAEEIKKMPPRYLLSEAEEAKIPSREELHQRYATLPQETLAKMDEMSCPSQEFLWGTVFTKEELPIFLKGERAADALFDELSSQMDGYDAWDAVCDYVWKKCLRRADLEGIYAYPPRHRMGMDLF